MPQRIIDHYAPRTVICIQCKEPVEKRQRKRGKAFCEECEESIFGERTQSSSEARVESFIDRKRMEQRMFEKMMGRMWRRMRM